MYSANSASSASRCEHDVARRERTLRAAASRLPPIIVRASSKPTAGTSWRARMTLRLSMRSGAVSTSVPSRSNTIVTGGMAHPLSRCPIERKPAALVAAERRPGYVRSSMDSKTTTNGDAAAGALEYVRPGMRLGLGTGSTAKHFVELLGERVRAGLDVIGVPTSEATRAQAKAARHPADDARRDATSSTLPSTAPTRSVPTSRSSRAAAARCCARRSWRRPPPGWW